jgi:hypothetical protein
MPNKGQTKNAGKFPPTTRHDDGGSFEDDTDAKASSIATTVSAGSYLLTHLDCSTMMLRAIFLYLATLSCQNALAFVTPSGGAARTLVAVRPSFVSAPPTTRLNVGISLEDFMSGRDEKKREKENEVYIQELQKRVDKINALEPVVDDMGDDELQAKTTEFKERLANGEDINGPLLEEAFAVVREAAW